MSILGRTSAGGRISAWLGCGALGICAGWSAATWLIITCIAAAGSNRQLGIKHANAIFVACYLLLDVLALFSFFSEGKGGKHGIMNGEAKLMANMMGSK